MTQEEKQLLIKALCEYFPYGVICSVVHKKDGRLVEEDMKLFGMFEDGNFYFLDEMGSTYSDKYIPYLRPMSSMTEEEMKELKSATCPEGTGYFDEQYLICPVSHYGEYISYDFMSDILEWLYSHHFDVRNLIEKGLALEAPEGMYNN